MKFKRKKKESVKDNPRPKREPLPTEGLGSSVFLAYGIVLLHVLLVAAIGLLVLFFRGIVHYMTWIFIAGLIFVFAGGYYFFRSMRQKNQSLKELLLLDEFSGRNVEIRLLGGLAALRMGEKKQGRDANAVPLLQLESREGLNVRELTELGRMYENALISREEYDIAKEQIFRNSRTSFPENSGRNTTEKDMFLDVSPLKTEREKGL